MVVNEGCVKWICDDVELKLTRTPTPQCRVVPLQATFVDIVRLVNEGPPGQSSASVRNKALR